ncbi:MAG: P1 family peptidase [Thermomicrobiales bacterium]
MVIPHPGNIYLDKVPAAIEVINGYGKTSGSIQVDELGTLETPIALTSTLCIGRAIDGLISQADCPNSGNWDSNGHGQRRSRRMRGQLSQRHAGPHVTADHVLAALDSASRGPVKEGAALEPERECPASSSKVASALRRG